MPFTTSLRGLGIGMLFVVTALVSTVPPVSGEDPASPDATSAIESQLEERVRSNPSDAAAWRMLGRTRMQKSDFSGAMIALRTAVQLDEESAAAFFDYGLVSKELGEEGQAAGAMQRVKELAPESEYARDAETVLQSLTAQGVVPIGYEVRTFDGSNDAPLIRDPRDEEETDGFYKKLKKDLDLRIDIGSQWNDNVSLSPVSREILVGDQASAQGTASLSTRYILFNNDTFRFGPTLDMDFTLNEGSFDRLNLQSYQVGAFADAAFEWDDITIKPRVAYTFTHDEFDGTTFGNRHRLATSLGVVWLPTQITTAYWSIDTNDIRTRRPNPEITSQDGVSNSIGLLHDYVRRDSKFRTFRVGADFSYADTDGSNFRYNGVSIYTQSVIVIVPKLHLTTRTGWAFRDYYDFTQSPNRDTHIWRTGAELRKYFDDGISAALVSQYDSFDSNNRNFRSDRFLVGGVATWEY